ncbi:hypothetical protein HYX19_02640 [Candidatus Woesearchaeota archaeon]|nr:hypothetical protein [Candidatus Woesearchaeota archaeon]
MKKATILGLGLAGILSIAGQNSSALEVNAKGFDLPNKNEYTPMVQMEMRDDKGNIMEFLYYFRSEKDAFAEIRFNGNLGAYALYQSIEDLIDMSMDKVYVLQDNNCDGVFETKYQFNEEVPDKLMPKCYLEKGKK